MACVSIHDATSSLHQADAFVMKAVLIRCGVSNTVERIRDKSLIFLRSSASQQNLMYMARRLP